MGTLRMKISRENYSTNGINSLKNMPNQSRTTHKAASVDSFSQNILYSCNMCKGPMVPNSNCIFCKRSTIRKCTNCDTTERIDSHNSCRELISFANTMTQNSKNWKYGKGRKGMG